MNNLAPVPRRFAKISEWNAMGDPITGRVASIEKKYLILETSKDEFISVHLFDMLKSLVDVKRPKIGESVRIGYVCTHIDNKLHHYATLEKL